MGDTYQYIGSERRGYLGYVDTDTHQMLIADPEGEYRMRAVHAPDPVPPVDGRWMAEDGSVAVADWEKELLLGNEEADPPGESAAPVDPPPAPSQPDATGTPHDDTTGAEQ